MQGAGDRMDNLDERIRKAVSAAQCLEILQSLAQETERIITDNPVTAGETQAMAECLSQIRGLLAELIVAWREAPANDPDTISALLLFERINDLEGRVKELRNDLDRERTRVVR